MADLNVKVGLDRSGFQTGLAAMENSVQKFGGRVAGILAGAFSFSAIGAGLARAIDQGDRLQDLANRFGVAASAVQEIGNAASLSGASIEDVASAMNKLARNAGQAVMDPQGNMAESFEKIGLSVEKLKGMSPQDLFMELSRAVASGALGMSDFTIAQDLAGRGALALMETFRMGPEAISKTGQAMGVMSDEQIASLSRASDAIKTLQNQMTMAFGGVAQFLSPAIEMFRMLAEQVGFAAASMGELFKGNFKDAMTIAATGSRARREFFEGKNQPAASNPVVRNLDSETISTKAQIDREKIRAQESLLKAEERYRDAVREREGRTLDATQQIGRAEAEIIDLQTQASALAENTAEKYELLAEIEKKRGEVMDLNNRRAEDAARLAEQEARAQERATQARQDFEGLTAELAGPKAELALQRRRTREAGQRARETGNVDDAVAAQRETLRLAQMETTRLRDTAFDDEDARRRGVRLAESARGVLPADAFTGNMQQVAQAIGQAVRDTALTNMPATQNQDGAKDGTVDTVRARVQECVDRLDQIIRLSGTFTY